MARARVYFELRDATGAIPCSAWRDEWEARCAREGVSPQDGMQLVVAGGCDYYPGSASASPGFSFAVHDLRVAGEGDLLARIERLRRQLRSEGLLERQKQLARPLLPRTIGVITGESGKARDDVLAALQRRGWRGRLVWAFTPVQDRHAAPAICRALADLAAVAEVQVAIIARGGGSQADLLALSDETLCRTVAMCAIPVIASVGHHTDRTLLDDVAAVSCSTPTHAAEAAVGIDCGRARRETLAAAVRLRDHGRRAVLSRARTLTMLSRAPAGRLERQRGLLHQRLRELRAGARRRLGGEQALAHRRGGGARAQGLLDAARLPPAAPPGARTAGAGARRPRPPADARTRLRAGLLARPASRSPTRPRHAPRASCDCASPTASWTPRCASHDRAGARRSSRCRTTSSATRRPAQGSRRSSGAWTRARRASTRRSRCSSEGKTLIELCARELAAVGDALQELRLDELVSRLEGSDRGMSDWERLAGLELEIEDYSLEPLQASVSSDFERKSTVIHLRGAGEEGLGEDVTYDAEDHEILQAAGPVLALAGRHTMGSFSELLAGMSLFPEPPQREVSERYRTWAYESAALDLALRQAGIPLHEALGRPPQPVRFVVSLRLGEPPSLEPMEVRLRRYPGLRFKLDPTSSWDERLIGELVATGAVDSVDFKGYYSGSIVDQPPDPVLYRRVAEAFPEAWIEDPALTEETDAALAPTVSASPGTPRSTRSRTSKRCPTRRGWSTSSPRGWGACATCSTPTPTARSGGSATTAAGSSSWGWAAGRTSTWPRCSTPTPPTTWPRRATTCRSPRRGCRAARWRRPRPRLGFRWG